MCVQAPGGVVDLYFAVADYWFHVKLCARDGQEKIVLLSNERTVK